MNNRTGSSMCSRRTDMSTTSSVACRFDGWEDERWYCLCYSLLTHGILQIVNPKGEMKGSAITGPVGKEAAELWPVRHMV